MKDELDSINRNNTWRLTSLPPGHKAIGLKWVFKTKKDADGKIIMHKARLVAKGYIQEHGINFEEVFAPVARMETIRLLLAIAANNKWQVHHLDVKSDQMKEIFEMSDLGLLAYYLGIKVTQSGETTQKRKKRHLLDLDMSMEGAYVGGGGGVWFEGGVGFRKGVARGGGGGGQGYEG
nr:ribonuclease H-like domain, reverse transcriptase, RNA-dependent DNA polymerase [Tanacetum cinerariifolium]